MKVVTPTAVAVPLPTASSSVSWLEAMPALSTIRSPYGLVSSLAKMVPAAPQVEASPEVPAAPAAELRASRPASMVWP